MLGLLPQPDGFDGLRLGRIVTQRHCFAVAERPTSPPAYDEDPGEASGRAATSSAGGTGEEPASPARSLPYRQTSW